jgi:hypothetical protein
MFRRAIKINLFVTLSMLLLTPVFASAQSILTPEGSVPVHAFTEDMVGNGGYDRAYSSDTDQNSIDVWDISDRDSPTLITSVPTHGNFPDGEYIKGQYLYVAEQGQEDTINGVTVPVSNFLEIYQINASASNPLTSVGYIQSDGAQPDQVAVKGNYAYLLDWAQPNSEVDVINVANPAAPVLTTQIPISSPGYISINGNYAYITSYSNGSLYTVDIAHPAKPVISNVLSLGGVGDIAINNGYAYVTNAAPNGSATNVLSLSNPAAPTLISTITTTSGNQYEDNTLSVFIKNNYLLVGTDNYYNTFVLAYDLSTSPTQPQLVQAYPTNNEPMSHFTPTSFYADGKTLYVVENGSGASQIEILKTAF